MKTKIQKWRNSQGIRISKQVLKDARISVGDDVDVVTRDGIIVVTPVRRVRGKRNLEELTAEIPSESETRELDWGKPVGKEAW